MERIVKNPRYSVEVRFYDFNVDLYDLISKEKIDSKSYTDYIGKIQKWGYNSFRLLTDEDDFIDWIYVELVIEKYKLTTDAGYIFDIQMDGPNHGYYIGTYEIGEFYYSEENNLVKKRAYPLEYCSRGCITNSKEFFLGIREITSLDTSGMHYLVKVDWSKKTESIFEWKKIIPSPIMAISIIDPFLYVGLRDGTLQIWDIDKEDLIESIKLFNSTTSIIEKGINKIIVGSSSGEIACISKNRKILWKFNISLNGIKGIYEDNNGIIIIDKKGIFFLMDPESGNIVDKQFLNLKEFNDPSISSNLIFIRDWFIISGLASIWVFSKKDYSRVFYRIFDDPLIRKLYPNPVGFYTGDDDGCIQFWKVGFKFKSVSEENREIIEKKPGFHDFELL